MDQITNDVDGDGSIPKIYRRTDLKHDTPQSRASSHSIVERIIQSEILPGLAALHAGDRREREAIPVSDAMVSEFSAAALSTDPAEAFQFIDNLLQQGMTKQVLFGQLLARTARLLGERWEQDLCSFVDVTVGLNRLHHILREHASANPPRNTSASEKTKSIFLMPAPGEQHIFGMLVLADYFPSIGWCVDIDFLNASPEAAVDTLTRTNCQCAGFTISNHRCTAALTDVVSTLRNSCEWGMQPILVGGALLQIETDLVARVGADASADNEVNAATIAESLIKSHARLETSVFR